MAGSPRSDRHHGGPRGRRGGDDRGPRPGHPTGSQARGKQAREYANHDCVYTRTTGIWQTVWLEARAGRPPAARRGSPRTWAAHLSASRCRSPRTGRAGRRGHPDRRGRRGGHRRGPGRPRPGAGRHPGGPGRPGTALVARRPAPVRPHTRAAAMATAPPWTGCESYAGLRSVAINGQAIMINGQRVFQRLVLDQGYWPERLMTAPDDEALDRTSSCRLAAGFNGARLHQKVFEERFCTTRTGSATWSGASSGTGAPASRPRHRQPAADGRFVAQWLEALAATSTTRSIVGWCPLNETHQLLHDRITQLDDVTRAMFLATKAADPTRPVLDARLLPPRAGDRRVGQPQLRAGPGGVRRQAGRPRRRTALREPATNGARSPSRTRDSRTSLASSAASGGIRRRSTPAAGADRVVGLRPAGADEEGFYARFAGLVGVLLDNPACSATATRS